MKVHENYKFGESVLHEVNNHEGKTKVVGATPCQAMGSEGEHQIAAYDRDTYRLSEVPHSSSTDYLDPI